MLGDNKVHVDIAVRDLRASRKFYEDVLGLEVVREHDDEVYYRSGPSELKIYQSSYAGTNQATYASWNVDDVPGVVAQLKAKGVGFERYDMPGVSRQGDVHIIDDMQAVWFRDPDGNILCAGDDG